MKKAFIAAPLIGTIIFVTAIVFVVSISKAESNAVSQIAQSAYQNRISAIIELYRSDAGSLFREDLKTVTEQALTSVGWDIFGIEVTNSPSYLLSEKEEALKTERFTRCTRIRDSLYSVVCSSTGDSLGDTECDRNCGNRADCRATEPSCMNNHKYGLQNFLSNINQKFEFEGMTLSPSNAVKFQEFFDPRNGADFDYQTYITNCKNLMQGVTIDCAAFSRGNLQCCKRDTLNPGDICEGDNIIPGCDSGIFFVKVTPNNPQVYASLPRLQVKDDAGNYLRTGALSDSADFYLPIAFPLMKYEDAAFKFYSLLAYGPQIGVNDMDREGILDGVCHGAVCASNALPNDIGFTQSSGSITDATREGAREKLVERFFEQVVKPAVGKMPDLIFVEFMQANIPVGRCTHVGTAVTCTGEDAIKKVIYDQSDAFLNLDGQGYSPYLGASLQLNVKIVDGDPSFKVNEDESNALQSTMTFKFK
ncbi:MAG: hypothetical protein V1722_00275 [Candidatus Micrarchaeota archaeon]